ncbi:MAG TPA: hypothetical protein VH062_02095 [Polyangiaceae bacterium]|nr:hypothetical protein [Polyangiaceae bacterium]
MARLLILACLLTVCSCTVVPSPAPVPVPPPAPVSRDGGTPDSCERFARQRAAQLAESAAAQGLPVERVTLVFEAACEPFLEDGPDAAISSGLSAADNISALVVRDGGAH